MSGLRPNQARTRLFLVLQAFIDESFDPNGVFVLGGYIASAEAWAAFTREWEELLPTALRDADGKHYFKMSSMARSQHIGRVPPFFRVIEKHVLGWISVKIHQSELKRAIGRVHVPAKASMPNNAIDWEKHTNAYYIAFRFMMDHFHSKRALMQEVIPLEETVDFYFDERIDKKTIFKMWDNYMRNRPNDLRKLYGAAPRFENDGDFLPLQASDLWVWHVRKWYAEGTPEKVRSCAFDGFGLSLPRKYLRIDISVGEEEMIQTLVSILRKGLPEHVPIYVLPPAAASLAY